MEITSNTEPAGTVPQDIRVQIGELVGGMIAAADERNANPASINDAGAALRALHAHTDAMRDLREALIRMGVLAL